MSTIKSEFVSLREVPDAKWKALAEKKIYFGHHSVGFNMIDGFTDILPENPQIKLNLIETMDPLSFSRPVFAHSRVGVNTNAISKIDDFERFMEEVSGSVDYAFFKFCFIDITDGTDIRNVFEHYKVKLKGLISKYPKTVFIHFTVPLTCIQTGMMVLAKKILRRNQNFINNAPRIKFNEMILNEYSGKGLVFDIASLESTTPNGKKVLFAQDGKNMPALLQDYTYDGGHLNIVGRKYLASQLLIYLANLTR